MNKHNITNKKAALPKNSGSFLWISNQTILDTIVPIMGNTNFFTSRYKLKVIISGKTKMVEYCSCDARSIIKQDIEKHTEITWHRIWLSLFLKYIILDTINETTKKQLPTIV